MQRPRQMQQVVYQVSASAVNGSPRLRLIDLMVIHVCEHPSHPIILTVGHFENQCKLRDDGKGCYYCQGYSLREYAELIARGYKADFYGKHICDVRSIPHRLI